MLTAAARRPPCCARGARPQAPRGPLPRPRPAPSRQLAPAPRLPRPKLAPITAATQEDADSAALERRPPHHTDVLPDRPGRPARRLTDVLIAANVAAFGVQLFWPEFTLSGVKVNALIDDGEYWRLLTPAFLHGSLAHLALNMLSLDNL